MVAQIYDELVLEVPIGELKIVDKVVEVMENVYPPKTGLPMAVDVEVGVNDWQDLISWGEYIEKTGN
jgi:DNA polymerase I-like protein with 3'-5' exonuclease and polymerase domains